MSATTGTAEQILSLPKGGGAVQGLGEKFQPDLHTGTGSYAVPLDVPNGPNDIAPKLTLFYHTGAGNGPFGMDFSLNLFTIRRSTDKRIPTYRDEEDPLVLVGGGELVDLGGGKYRLQVDTNDWQIEREGEGFKLIDREGKYYRLGITEQARLFTVEDGHQKILSWHLEEIEDPLGNKARFTYRRDGNQLYLEQVDYSIYSIRFEYQERLDPLIDGRAGFLVTTRLRCTKIELLVTTASSPLTRRWDLEYFPGSRSLLQKVTLTGFDGNGRAVSLPTLTLGYTKFQPRRLKTLTSEVPDAVPGSFSDGRRELLDWDGDGLPDLIEMGGGRARVFPNLGDGRWGRPQSISALPAPVALDEPGVAFADMEGNGTADLVMLDRPLAGYYPHQPGGGFDQPVFWRQTPSARLSDPNARLVDLNGDGIIDLLVTGNRFFSLYYRQPNDGWQARPQTIPRSYVPPVSLSDPRIHLADMNGDGLQDLVRVNGAGVTYWPYLGDGRWGDAIELDNPPRLPLRFDPQRLFLNDVDGDGCADLVYVDFDRVIYWLNIGGKLLSDPQEIPYTPPALPGQFRLADMMGNGTAGILWSYTGAASRTARSLYLDFTGDVKPYLLNRIDNGMGLVTEIEYGTSTAEAARDRAVGRDWETFLPFPVPVVTAIRVTDQATSRQSLSSYRYHNGHYDGVRREFAGFGMVEVEETGDDALATMLTRNWHHIGLDPVDLSRALSDSERTRLRTLRGKLLKTEIYGLDGSADQEKPYLETENNWNAEILANVNDVEVLSPRLLESRILYFERQSTPYRVTITRNLSYDEFGNVTEQEQRAEDPRDSSLTRVLHTVTIFATDPLRRFVSKPARIVQHDGNGQIVATTISYYDGLSEGQVGVQGLLTHQESLVLTDNLVSQVYGGIPPDFANLGYHRRTGEGGWWINQVSYTRTDDAHGLRGTVTNAKGNTTQIFFDRNKIQPSKIVDALDNSTEALFDYRANKLRSLTDVNGVTISNQYDPIGRLVWTVEPGASDALPTTRYIYHTNQTPVQLVTEQRAVNGQAEVTTRKVYLDGSGQVIEERMITSQGEIVERSQLYSVRGLIRVQFLPYMAVSSDYIPPTPDLPHRKFLYDALGRLIEVMNPDGSILRQRFEPGEAFLYDEEDTRTDSNALHADTPMRHIYDPTGRIVEVALNDGGRWIPTHYEYDIKGNLLGVVKPSGQRTSFWYDLLGRRLRTDSPDSGTSLFTFDANGNQVERRDARGEVVSFEFDELDRLKRVRFPVAGEVLTEYEYHDTGRPAPPEARNFTKGRIVKVTHQGGEEIFDYDPLGRVTHKTIFPSGLPGRELRLDFTYRADGQRDTVTYPELAPGAGRLHIRYEYNQRGLLKRIPDYIRQIDYNLVGQRTSVEYANDIITTYRYDPLTLRLEDLLTKDGLGSVLQHFEYDYDQVGNLFEVKSPDPKMAANYGYDDLYRLKTGSTQSGGNWTYGYDDLGNLTSKSDVGIYHYSANGLLETAGVDAFTYTSAGQMFNTPWGECEYDPIGRLTSIIRGSEQMLCTYDHNGRRVRMEVTSASSSLDFLTPDDMISVENGVFFAYVLDGAVRVAQIRLGTGVVSFLHGDHLGSTTLVTGPVGQVLQRVYYDPFGAVLENNVSAGTDGTRFLYTGQVWDAWSGLLYLNTRYYNPKLGRFITPDTVVPGLFNPQAWNRYSYVQNNPLRFIDPTGHFLGFIGEFLEKAWSFVKDSLKYIVTIYAILAIATLSVVTFGAVGLAVVGIAMAIGGVVGGISAANAGGDILLGVLVGMAVGGGAAFAGMGIGAGLSAMAVTAPFHGTTAIVNIISGTISGAINGAAMGFVSGYAGGQGTAGDIFDRMWKGALVGAITGFAFNFAGSALSREWVPFPEQKSFKEIAQGLSSKAKSLAEGGSAAGSVLGAGVDVLVGRYGPQILDFVLKTAPYWHVGLTSAASGILVLDYADDIWEMLGGIGVEVKSSEDGGPSISPVTGSPLYPQPQH